MVVATRANPMTVDEDGLPIIPAPGGFEHIARGINDFLAQYPNLDPLDLKRFGEARERNLRADMLELEIAEKRGSLIPVAVVKAIRDDTVNLVNNNLGPSFQAMLEQHGLPSEVAQAVHEQMYQGLANIYHHYSHIVAAAQQRQN